MTDAEQPKPRMRDGLIKRGKQWYYVVYVLDPETGRKKPKWYKGGATRTEAAKARDNARQAANRGRLTTASDWTVAAWLDHWITGHAVAIEVSTLKEYRGYIRRNIKPSLGVKKLTELDPIFLAAAFAEMAKHGGKGGKPLSPRSVEQIRAILRVALADAVVSRLTPLEVNPAQGAKIAKRIKPKHTTWTAGQLGLFLSVLADHRLYAFYHLAAYTGARRGELLGLRWHLVDLDAATVSIGPTMAVGDDGVTEKETPKNDENRVVDVDEEVTVPAMRAYRRRQAAERLAKGLGRIEPDTRVFSNPDGSDIHPDSMTKMMVTLVRQAQIVAAMRERLTKVGTPVVDGRARCPAHEDDGAALVLSLARRYGELPFRCETGCDRRDVMNALGVTPASLRTAGVRLLPRLKLHELRHTHATLLLKAGVPVHVVSKRLGHRDPTVTLRIYADVQPDQGPGAAGDFAALMG